MSLSVFYDSTAQIVSDLVGNPKHRYSRDAAQLEKAYKQTLNHAA